MFSSLKKSIFISFLMLLFSAYAVGQDMIVKKNGDDLNVKVVEINSLEVKYKISGSTDSTLKSMPKSEIFFIKIRLNLTKLKICV
ncbi:MAG: hypothetical protein K2Q22_07975 [Cytophagales bacterium]|nr:hypothetical protein [Cytophagales bacterium]